MKVVQFWWSLLFPLSFAGRAQFTPSPPLRRPWTGPPASCGETAVAPARTSSRPPQAPPRLWARSSPSSTGPCQKAIMPGVAATGHCGDGACAKMANFFFLLLSLSPASWPAWPSVSPPPTCPWLTSQSAWRNPWVAQVLPLLLR